MAVNYGSKEPVNLQEAVRDLNARLQALNTQVNPPKAPVAPAPKPPVPPAPPKP